MICAQHTRRAAPRSTGRSVRRISLHGLREMPARSASRFSWPLTAQLRSSCLGVVDLQPVQAVDCRSLSTVYGSTAVLPIQYCTSRQVTTPLSQHQRRSPARIHPTRTPTTFCGAAPRRSLICTLDPPPLPHLTVLPKAIRLLESSTALRSL